MTDSKAIDYKSNFLEAVREGEYEDKTTPLPQVMNLLETFNGKNTVLHCCALNNYLLTFEKILDCPHPAVGLLIEHKNIDGYSALDTLLKSDTLSNEQLNVLLEKMQNRSLPTRFAEILNSSLKRMERSDYSYNTALKPSVMQFYTKVDQEISIVIQGQPYTPGYYYPRQPIAVPVASLGSELTVNQKLSITSKK